MRYRSATLATLALAAVVVVTMSGCTGRSTQSSSDATPVKITVGGNGRAVELSTGQQLLVILPANPSTGYSWDVRSMPSIVETVGEPAFVSDSSGNPQLVGAAGTTTFTFRAKATGTGGLQLDYRRPWEKNVAPNATFSLDLTVK